VVAGNVRETPLGQIYAESPLFRSLRDKSQLKGRCGQCEFNTVCGGSRSRAYAMTGDVLAEEPFCTYQPGSFPFMEEVQALADRAG
jgi:radical SAM protein with 4Fe4S-binding SPASM domain